MDTITFNLMIITGGRYYQVGTGYYSFITICMGTTGYYVFNLKEYYIGEYFLQEINAIDEGSAVYFLVYVYAFYHGWEGMQEDTFLGIRPSLLIFFPTLFQQVI